MNKPSRIEIGRCIRHTQLIAAAIALAATVILAGPCAAVAAHDLDDLAFLVGHWRGEALGGVVEEIWLPAEGDVMHAVFRAASDGAMGFSEFMQITREDGGVIMRFAHFRPDYTTWEGDGPPMTLRLVEAGTTRAVFEGVNDASPDRIVSVVGWRTFLQRPPVSR